MTRSGEPPPRASRRLLCPYLFGAAALALAACADPGRPPEAPAVAPPPSGERPVASAPEVERARAAPSRGSATVSGAVGGRALAVKSAVFLWRERANDLALVLSDADGLCEALSAGAWPESATVLYATLKHNAQDNRDAPFAAGEYALRSAGARAAPQDTKQAVVMQLDAACAPSGTQKATEGVVRITTPEIRPGATAEGSFDLHFGADRLEGRFAATFCKPPEDEPHGCRR